MKRLLLAMFAIGTTIALSAQTDSTGKEKADTIRIGGIIIINKGGKNDTTNNKEVVFPKRNKKHDDKVSTNWFVVDLGFANYNDQTNYAAAASEGFIASGINKDDLKLRTGKSVNVNIWLFMQRLSLIKQVVNLKYGLGTELNNYRFDNETIRIQENPTKFTLDPSLASIKKNKLAADYVTIPVLLNFNFTPKHKNSFELSGGISAGYLYSARQKFKMNGEKDKTHDDFNLRKWKLSYIGEAALGPVRLYGSYAIKSMWEKGLDQQPYNIGLRFSHL